MNKILLLLLIVGAFGCKSEVNHKQVLLDSLKQEYAGKDIHLTFTNNEAHTEPLVSQYAYVDRKRSDLAFELNSKQVYKLAFEEGIAFVPTTEHPKEEYTDMVLIEIPNTSKRGFISYKLIKEFGELSIFDH
jgi:hypothetical protein